MNRALLAVGLAAWSCAGQSRAEAADPDPEFGPAIEEVAALVDSGRIPSAAFSVVLDGRILIADAVGLADAEEEREATGRTPYPLASATKPIVALAAVALAERGELDLDVHPGHPALESASLAQLLGHTGGLPTYLRIYWGDDADACAEASFERYAIEALPPGAVFEYSNIGYGLAGDAVARAAGGGLAEALDGVVFEPLGMRDASLPDGPAVPDGAAVKCGKDGVALPPTCNDTPGAGNVYASAEDLARFMRLFVSDTGPRIVGQDSLERMMARSAPDALYTYYGGAGYGLGWYVRDLGGERLVWHEGGMPGASTIMAMAPARGLAVCVLINANDANDVAQRIATSLWRAVDPGAPAIELEATEGFEPYVPPSPLEGRWSGTVRIDGRDLPMAMEFGAEGMVEVTLPSGEGGSAAGPVLVAWVGGDLVLVTLEAALPGEDVLASSRYGLVRLLRRGDELDGFVAAYSSVERLEHLYPYAISLRREE